MVLLTPGPCMTSEAVRAAAAREDLNHREPEFLEIVHEVKGALGRLSGGMVPSLVGGSGTAGMEAMATSLVESGPVLVLADGYYSGRMAEIFDVHGIPAEVLEFDWVAGWDLARVEEALAARPFEWVAACHHETTTGRLNPVGALGEISRRHGARLMVDAMSSLGADPLPFDSCEAVVASANKCLHGLPGVAFVLTREPVRPLDRGPRTYYLDLTRYAGDIPPLTAPVPMLSAFRQALREFESRGGQPGRQSEYEAKAATYRAAFREKGYPLLLDESLCSTTLVSAALPAPWAKWFQWHLDRGYVVYGCKGPLAETHFQVSTMGELSVGQVEEWGRLLPRFEDARRDLAG